MIFLRYQQTDLEKDTYLHDHTLIGDLKLAILIEGNAVNGQEIVEAAAAGTNKMYTNVLLNWSLDLVVGVVSLFVVLFLLGFQNTGRGIPRNAGGQRFMYKKGALKLQPADKE